MLNIRCRLRGSDIAIILLSFILLGSCAGYRDAIKPLEHHKDTEFNWGSNIIDKHFEEVYKNVQRGISGKRMYYSKGDVFSADAIIYLYMNHPEAFMFGGKKESNVGAGIVKMNYIKDSTTNLSVGIKKKYSDHKELTAEFVRWANGNYTNKPEEVK